MLRHIQRIRSAVFALIVRLINLPRRHLQLQIARLTAPGILGDVRLALCARRAATVFVVRTAGELEVARTLLLGLLGLVYHVLLGLHSCEGAQVRT